MQKNASGGQGLFVFYGREPKRPPFGRRGGASVCRLPRRGGAFAPALLRTRASVRRGGGGEGSGGRGFCNINTKNKKFFQDKY